jgi:hypothetical protein
MLVFTGLKLFVTSAALGKKCQFKLEGVFTGVISKTYYLTTSLLNTVSH